VAQPDQVLDRYDLNTTGDNVREDLTDIIYNISPTERPFHMNADRTTAESDLHEWTIDSLADARADNAHIDGDDFQAEGDTTPAAPSGGVFQGVAINGGERIGNYQQISRKDINVTRRANLFAKAGRKSEIGYQISKAGLELQRDCEQAATNNQQAVQGSATVAPRTAGLAAWLRTNTNRGSGGADPTLSNTTFGQPNAAATDGTLRALSETALLDVISDIYEEGGDPNMIMLDPRIKRRFSNYMFSANARIATQYQDAGPNKSEGLMVVGSVDVYVSDFGVLDVVPNRFQRERDVFILDPDMWAISYADGYHTIDIGKTGDNDKKVLLVDWGVESRNEAASGIIADIDNIAMVA
jgi:hypothetical protein